MNKLKRTLSLILIISLTVCASVLFAACTDKKDYPDYRNPANGGYQSGEYDGKYIVSVVSLGGLNLNGVAVSAQKDGATVMSGVSKNGTIEFAVPAGEYKLVVDPSSLPEGYYVPDDADYKTEADRATATVAIPSRIIATTATSGTSYQLGDVMHDFGFTESGGGTYKLSEMLATKKAVAINFWYVSCNPCKAEFPAMEKAYRAYGDRLEIIALSTQDNQNDVRKFKDENNLSFLMAPDQSGISRLFSITATPTTIIVDRYGVVAYRSSGSETKESTWKALFNKYTSDDYTQSSEEEEDNGEYKTEYEKAPEDLSMASQADIAAAVNGEGTDGKILSYMPETNEKDAPYSWPWIIGEENGEKYLYASNTKTDFSYAILYVNISLREGDVLSYDYSIDSEEGNDILYVLIDGRQVAEYSGKTEEFVQEYGVYYADRDVDIVLSFCYIKDQLKSEGDDMAKLKNFTVTDITASGGKAIDARISATSNVTLSDGSYNLPLIAPYSDGNDSKYYRIKYTDDEGKEAQSILFADITHGTTSWAAKHAQSNFTSPEGSSQEFSLYLYSYWMMSNYENVGVDESTGIYTPLRFDYGTSDDAAISDVIIENYYLEGFSSNTLVPVTEELKDAIDAFVRKYCNVKNETYYADQWLEFCYYFKHFGLMTSHEKDKDGNPVCRCEQNPVLNMSWTHATELGKNHINMLVEKPTIYSYKGGGSWYSFTPTDTGVYLFYSEPVNKSDTVTDPILYILDEDDNVIVQANNDIRYDHFRNKYLGHFYVYVELEANKTYKVQCSLNDPQATGSYRLRIEHQGKSAVMLRVCSTDDGTWDSYGNYNAIKVGRSPDDGYYHAITKDYSYGSLVYIDFVNPNYYDQNGHTLYEMILADTFNFTSMVGKDGKPMPDYTQKMLDYYQKAIANTGELHGLVAADQELVDILDALTFTLDGDGPKAFAWLMFASYYEYYGTAA